MSVGGNDEACRYSGINDKLVILKTFVLSGLSTAIGAILLCSRGASAQCTIGESYEFDVISGVILGGASLNGRKRKRLQNICRSYDPWYFG